MVMISKNYPFFGFFLKKDEKESSQQTKIARDLSIEQVGFCSGFYKKKPTKITLSNLFLGFWQMQDKNENTLRNWAINVGVLAGETVTKQAVDNRLSWSAMEAVKMILKNALSLKLKSHFDKAKQEEANQRIYAKFNNILIQDSTVQKLPSNLSEIFQSSHSRGKKAASLRVQATYNFTREEWVNFEIGSYTDNDQSNAMAISQVAKKKDLILRDLAYSTLDSIEQLSESQYFVCRKTANTLLLDPATKKRIDLLELFEGKQQIDQAVLVGKTKLLPLRLVAKKLPEKKAKKRIEEAKNDRHSKANHSEEYYQLLTWEILLTNIPKDLLEVTDIIKLYQLRWYIEILFKAWKSYANFKTMLSKKKMDYKRAIISIYLLLIRFVYYTLDIYHYIQQQLRLYTSRSLSILKFTDLCRSLSAHILFITHLHQLQAIIPQFVAHATYEKRKDRKNMQQKYLYFKELRIS